MIQQIPSPVDWNSFSQHMDRLDATQIKHLQELTCRHLEAGNDERKARFIKVAYVDHFDGALPPNISTPDTLPRAVLWEEHPEVQGLDLGSHARPTSIKELKKSLQDAFPDVAKLKDLKTELYFTSTSLKGPHVDSEENEDLRQHLIFYCDKVYAKPVSPMTSTCWQQYKKYFQDAQRMVLACPSLYTKLCNELRSLLTDSEQEPLEEKVYRYLVLLRSLPESLAYSDKGYVAAAESVNQLLTLLDDLDRKLDKVENKVTIYEAAVYNVINVLEWLVYLMPKMYTVQIQSTPLYEDVVKRLEDYITGKRYKLAIRLEAAWALGWASVSSITVATFVQQRKKEPKSRVHELNSSILRQVVGIACLRASFTLASFGPARVVTEPGSYLTDQVLHQNGNANDDARQETSKLIYNELSQIVRGNSQFLLGAIAIAELWGLNTLITTLLLQNAPLIVKAGLLIPPTVVLLVTIVMFTLRWQKEDWFSIAMCWVSWGALALVPWVGSISWKGFLTTIVALSAIFLIGMNYIGPFVTFVTWIRALWKKVEPRLSLLRGGR